ncbi:hypothetical protein V5O48_002880 [Marasmius crinis-equi]|uniref:Uncharacterized protein n=1 Tax=Marasmius crinis-equi TaxID=585013 RepID=A0ABR3FUD9_9AGAR
MSSSGPPVTQNGSKRHAAGPSIDTNASGFAESAISFSAFPEPPSSIPSTPARSTFSGKSITNTRQSPVPSFRPLQPNRKKKNTTLVKQQDTPPPSRPFSPHDWHEGASSIDVDATEDRLLSTSFITSLLQESSDGASTRTRRSVNSDAVSGFSEMTYPPPSRHFISASPVPSTSTSPTTSSAKSPRSAHHKYPSQRPTGSRPLPATFSPIPEGSNRRSTLEDDDTLDSTLDNGPTVIRSASRSQGFRGPVPAVGVAPATIRSLSGISGQTLTHDVDVLAPHDEEEGRRLVDHGNSRDSPEVHLRNLASAHNTPSRQSFHSSKSFATSIISRISAGVARVVPWRRTKPLPPVPPLPRMPIPMNAENPNPEARVPLSDLATRADALNGLLEKGYHPHHSIHSYDDDDLNKDGTQASMYTFSRDGGVSRRSTRANAGTQTSLPKSDPKRKSKLRPLSSANKKRYCIVLAVFIVVAGVAVGAGVGVSVSRKGPSLPKCSGQTTGMACDLNATCICTSNSSGSCLAKALVDAIPGMNAAFNTNYTLSSAYNSLWQAHTVTSDSDCVSQALLIDAAPGLKFADSPNRTGWARSALLWNLLQSQDTKAIQTMQDAIKQAPWSSIKSDGVAEDKDNKFSTTASGFTFNFATQTVSQPGVTFLSNGQPISTQISKVSGAALDALNRMYSFAFASSTQRQTALSNYWTSVLQQRADDLPAFKSAVISASILIPFDGTSSSLSPLMTNNSDSQFPPPLSCYAGLNQSVVDRINSVEQTVFGLSSASAAARFDTSCFSARPIYGVLDVLRLRLPFIDSRTGTAKSAAVLRREAYPRAVLHSGELLSSFPLSSNSTPFILNPRDHGTVNNVNHIILNYLTSITDINLAISLVKFIMQAVNRDAPPASDSDVVKSLSSIPPIEVAIFGTVAASDVSSVVSSFSTPSGSMFFGSPEAQVMRQWSISALSGGSVQWAENALSNEFARDATFDDSIFNEVWKAAATALETNASNVGVKNVTDSLRSTGKLSTS